MSFNLFSCIREGVKQSILLGVSDAIETIGVPDNSEDLHPRLVEFLRREPAAEAEKRLPAASGRKRLGRTLKDLEMQPESGTAEGS